ncbi:TPA: AI-2E family transporter [Candidatus Ventrenecus stercoripullorum]|nr:AI-2E family transporter [Candidatus Ventrenecus stercoripullorum]
MKLFKQKDKLNMEEVNDVISLSKKILHLLYTVMIIAIILIVTIIAREWGIWNFILNILSVLAPFFLGFILAWILNPLVTRLERKKIPRTLGAFIVYAAFLLILLLFIRFLIPTIYQQLQILIANLPGILKELEVFINNIFDKLGSIQGIDFQAIQESILTTISSYFSSLMTSVPTMIMNFASGFVSSMITICFGLVIGIYMLIDFDSINGHLLHLLPEKNRFEASLLIANISTEVRKSVNGTLMVATMVFICDSIGFWIVGLQAPVLFGLLCGITDLIPYVGPYIGGAVAVIIGFSQSPLVGFLTLIVAIIVQLLENNVLQPLIMSKTMKLHPVTIIVGLLIFEHFFGIIGMILCTPCIALAKVVWKFFKEKYNWFEKRPMLTNTKGE